MQRLYRCTPSMGGLWSDSIRWIFILDNKHVKTRNWEDNFFNSLLRAWEHVHRGLGHGVPTCEDEYLRQHLVWNPNMRLPSGHMLGSRTTLDWAKLDAWPGSSVDAWKSFHTLHINDKSDFFSSLRGGGLFGTRCRQFWGTLPLWYGPLILPSGKGCLRGFK